MSSNPALVAQLTGSTRRSRLVLDAVLGALTILLFVGIRYHEPPWMQPRSLLSVGAALGVAYAIALALLRLQREDDAGVIGRLLRIAAVGSLVCAPVLVGVIVFGVPVQKLTLLVELALVYTLLVLNGSGLPRVAGLGATIALFALGASTCVTSVARASAATLIRGDEVVLDEQNTYLRSLLHDVRVVTSQVVPPETASTTDFGGALELVTDSTLLLADAHGRFFEITLSGPLASGRPLTNVTSPMNRTAYERDVQEPTPFFRITDLLLVDDGNAGRRTLYVAHHRWDEAARCVVLAISEAEVITDALDQTPTWSVRFRTDPCISVADTIGNLSGGRMALVDATRMLLTVGVTRESVISAPAEDYGKVLEIDRRTWRSADFTSGHRNPQGLLVDGDVVWSTEHGPDGGDELNLLRRGRDYGWPSSSYGVDYGTKTFRGSDTPGEHSAGERPQYAWVPSVGVSQLLKVRGDAFPEWRGDLLVASLGGRGHGRALFRVRVHDQAVRVVEPIRAGFRVRDLLELPGGEIVVWDGVGGIHVLTPATHIFSPCSSCHTMNRFWLSDGVGPDLRDVFGRRTGAVAGFNYSEGMRSLRARWTAERLDWFLRDPAVAVPGTSMDFPGISDPAQRRAIIQYLRDAGLR